MKHSIALSTLFHLFRVESIAGNANETVLSTFDNSFGRPVAESSPFRLGFNSSARRTVPQRRKIQSNSYDYQGLFHVIFGYNQRYCSGIFPTLGISCPQEIQIDSVTRAFCRTTSNADASCDIQAGIPSADVHFRCFADSHLSLDPVAYIGGRSYSCGYGAFFVEHFLYLGQVCRSALSVDYW